MKYLNIPNCCVNEWVKRHEWNALMEFIAYRFVSASLEHTPQPLSHHINQVN